MPLPSLGNLSLKQWIWISAFVHVFVLGLGFSKQKMMPAVIPVEFFYTAPAPPAQKPVTEPAPPKPAPPPPPKKSREKPVEKTKDIVPKPIPKKTAPKTEAPQKSKTETVTETPKPVASQPTSRIVMTRQAFPFSYYARIIQQKVWREWDWSAATGRRKAVVLFRIQRDGTLASSRVDSSSGEPLFDQAAVRAVQLAAPFPPLPAAYADESLDVFFEFNFQE